MGKVLDVGLTGGIGCGKSLVLRIFSALGCATLDSDQIYHELIKPGRPLAKKLIRTFGKEISREDGGVDRRALARLVFEDESKRQTLNSLAHPAVVKAQKRLKKDIRKRFKKENVEHGIIITDAALMIEAGTYKNYDALIVVSCPVELQIQRIIERDGISQEEAEKRINSQMPVAEKETYADYVITNDKGPKDLIPRVEEVLARLYESMV